MAHLKKQIKMYLTWYHRYRAPHVPPQKTSKSLFLKMLKHKNMRLPWIFSQPHVPPQKNWKWLQTCSDSVKANCFIYISKFQISLTQPCWGPEDLTDSSTSEFRPETPKKFESWKPWLESFDFPSKTVKFRTPKIEKRFCLTSSKFCPTESWLRWRAQIFTRSVRTRCWPRFRGRWRI
jgi:hypothetical protein